VTEKNPESRTFRDFPGGTGTLELASLLLLPNACAAIHATMH